MNNIHQLFFELIRVAIGTQESLSRMPSAREWAELYKMAQKQSLVGICFAGIQKLGADADGGFARIGINEMLYLTWMGMTAQIQQRNEVMNRQCVELQAKLSADGFKSCILKGQGVAQLYAEHLRGLRQSGDIDIYVNCSRKKAIEYAHSIQGKVDWDYKHLHLNVFEGTEVEMHYVPELSLNLIRNARMQRWFKSTHVQESIFKNNDKFVSPSVEFNLFFILLHTYRHFLYEGVGMRQLMDYYFVLNASSKVSRNKLQEISKTIERFGMKKFTSGVMWIMKEVFGLAESNLLCIPEENEGWYIIEQVMAGGNFGKHDERLANWLSGKKGTVLNVLRHNWLLLRHYPSDVIWSPIYIAWHFCWKRYMMMQNR